ncbi:hypothetical protein [Hymenobacter edaphi]|uniref:hypothetical protein n=1 Tax=Hymenobacter edaphi TaxID=2211146 RepID=UPI001057A735|nr:hypothetical protein [Hymenobacter edaphi]
MAAISGDSTLRYYHYQQGVLSIVLDVYELHQSALIRVRTDQVAVDNRALKHNSVSCTCFIELTELSTVLAVQHGVYVPSPDFGGLMQQVRNHHHLAYGRRLGEAKLLLALRGSGSLLTCLLPDSSAVTVELLAAETNQTNEPLLG